MKFDDLGIRAEIVKALSEEEIITPTEIQAKAIPLALEGKDIIGISKTGSGKTATFCIPTLETIEPKMGVQALVLCPTRELAVQIAGEFKKFGKYLKLSVATVYGGVSYDPQIKKMSNSEIVVATPGRMLDHLEKGNVTLETLKVAVLDEADRMAEMGFIEDVSRILQAPGKKTQILLFGATIVDQVQGLERKFMKNPSTVKASKRVDNAFLKQYYYPVKANEKFSLLIHLLEKEATERIIIFCSTRHMVEQLTRNLRCQKIRCDMIHGKLSQSRRLKVIESFNKGNPKVLIASSVAARGLHIEEVSHVINWDLSQDSEEYVHRVGRTARAGESGSAITLLSDRDHDVFNEILHRQQMKIEKLPPENFKKLRFDFGSRRNGRSNGNRNGRRSGNGKGFSGKSKGPRSDGPRQHHDSSRKPVVWGGR